MLLIEDECSSSFFNLFNTNSGISVLNYGKLGRGPGEFPNSPLICSQTTDSAGQPGFYYWDSSLRKVCHFNIHKGIQNIWPISRVNIDIPDEIGSVRSVFYLDNSVLGYCNRQNYQFCITSKDYKITKIKDHSNIVDFFDPGNERYVYSKNSRISPNGDFFVYSYTYIKAFSIVDLDGNVLITIKFRNNDQGNLFRDFPINNDSLKIHYSFPFISNKYIYILDVNNYSNFSHLNADPVNSEIHMFKHTGEPIKRIVLDNRVISFSVSNDEWIYAGVNESDYILKYNINK